MEKHHDKPMLYVRLKKVFLWEITGHTTLLEVIVRHPSRLGVETE